MTKHSLSSMALLEEVTPAAEKGICSAIATMVTRGYAGTSHNVWLEISQKIVGDLKADLYMVGDMYPYHTYQES